MFHYINNSIYTYMTTQYKQLEHRYSVVYGRLYMCSPWSKLFDSVYRQWPSHLWYNGRFFKVYTVGNPATVESWLHPWWPSNQLGVLHHLCTVPIYTVSCYSSDNKRVLSYLLLCLLPQWWPRSGCTLCIVHCTVVHPHPHSHVGSHQR